MTNILLVDLKDSAVIFQQISLVELGSVLLRSPVLEGARIHWKICLRFSLLTPLYKKEKTGRLE